MSFLCLCAHRGGSSPSGVRARTASPEKDAQNLRRQLTPLAEKHGLPRIWTQAPAALAADRYLQVGEVERGPARYLACFSGRLDNANDLLQRHCCADLDQGDCGNGAAIPALLVHLYLLLGKKCLCQLVGSFNLLIVDAVQGQVLAACSESAHQPLVEARTAAGNTVISTSPALLPLGCTSLHLIPQGHCKYALDAAPMRFAPGGSSVQQQVFTSASASQAAPSSPFISMSDSMEPLALPHHSRSSVPASTPSSASSFLTSRATGEGAESAETSTLSSLQDPGSGSFKKTRRGKRAGKNLKLRNAESELRRAASDMRRSAELQRVSFDSQASTSTTGDMDWHRSSVSVPQPVAIPHHSRSLSPRRSSSFRPTAFRPSSQGPASARDASLALISPRQSQRTPPSSFDDRGMLRPSPGSLQDALLPQSPLVAHDGKADAAWDEASAEEGLSLRPHGPAKLPPVTPRRKQPGFDVLHPLPEHASGAEALPDVESQVAMQQMQSATRHTPMQARGFLPSADHSDVLCFTEPAHGVQQGNIWASAAQGAGSTVHTSSPPSRPTSPFTPRSTNVSAAQSPTRSSPSKSPSLLSPRGRAPGSPKRRAMGENAAAGAVAGEALRQQSPSRFLRSHSPVHRQDENASPALAAAKDAQRAQSPSRFFQDQPAGAAPDAPLAALHTSPARSRGTGSPARVRGLLHGLLTQASKFASYPNLASLADDPSRAHIPAQPVASAAGAIGRDSIPSAAVGRAADLPAHHLLSRLQVSEPPLDLESRFAAAKSRSCTDLPILEQPTIC